MIRFALALIAVGVLLLGGLAYAWTVAPELAVVTIMPMMGTPYIIGVASLCYGIQGLFIELSDLIKHRGEYGRV